MLKTMVFVLLPLLVLGCAGSPSRVLLTKSDKLKDVSTFDLCKTYFLNPTAKLKLELKERNAFTVEEWSFIDEQKIYLGMREAALVCAWGHPGCSVRYPNRSPKRSLTSSGCTAPVQGARRCTCTRKTAR